MNVQTVSAADLKVIDIVARWQGSAHDSTIFNNSNLKRRFERGEFKDYVLVGDQGYANTNYLITPLTVCRNPIENLCNESIIRTRNCVERQYGVLKRRFPILSRGMQLKCLESIQFVIVATAVLHNFAIEENDRMPPVDPQIQAEIDDLNMDDNVDAVPIHQNRNGSYRDRLLREYYPILHQRSLQLQNPIDILNED